jgi:F420-dependent oxidoreductase-like protein
MRVGLHPVRFGPDPATIAAELRELGRAADEVDLDHVFLMDHHLQMDFVGPVDDPVLEGYTALGYLAALTGRVRLGLLVTGVTYRHPGILAKQVATLDVLSGGRASLGLGAAWYRGEHEALGVPFPPLAERFERLDETLQICARMFAGRPGPYEGRHYRLADTRCRPLPLQGADLPVVVGGGGEKQTLRLVATHAHACNLIADAGAAEVAHKLDVLDDWCARLGRDAATVRRTVMWTGDPLARAEDLVALMTDVAALGVEEVTLVSRGDHAGVLAALAEQVLPALRALQPAPRV